MSLYLSDPNVWMPQDPRLAWMAVLVPSPQRAIATREEFLELLCLRLEWEICRWQAESPHLGSPYQPIERAMVRGGMNQFLPSRRDSPRQWAEAVILHNSVLYDKMGLYLSEEFPVEVLTNPQQIQAALARIENTRLEEWLEELTAD